jgi:hypothetical protein
MENQSEIIGNIDGSLIGFLEAFLNLFFVEGASVEAQQLIKISILFIAILFIVSFLAIVFKFLKIWIESMQRHPEYIFFIIMTVLVFSFAGDFSFGGACLAILIFYYWNLYISQSLSKKQNLKKKSMQTQANQRIGGARTAKLATGAARKR